MASPYSHTSPSAAGMATTNANSSTWTVVPNATFDKVIAAMLMNPEMELDSIGDIRIRREDDGTTLLHVAAGMVEGELLVARFLMAGISPNVTDNTGWTPLHEAAEEGLVAACSMLLQCGATPDLVVQGVTPLRAAINVGHVKTTQWLLQQQGTWSGLWDNELFAALLEKTPGAVETYLDCFAPVLKRRKHGLVGIRYKGLRSIFGEPTTPVEETALALVAANPDARTILPHRVMKYIMRAKWRGFGHRKLMHELMLYLALLVAYFIPAICVDANWVKFESAGDVWVAVSRVIAWICCWLLLHREWREYRGDTMRHYFSWFWNWLSLATYLSILLSIPLEFIPSMATGRDIMLALILVWLWINLLRFLQVSSESGLLVAMMAHMVKDVYLFIMLYVAIVLGFSGAFYTLLRGKDGYETFGRSIFTACQMLFGAIDLGVYTAESDDPEQKRDAWKANVAIILVIIYLFGVVVVLLNILIAMMATTYSDVWDAAEGEALGYQAQVLVSLEKSLTNGERKRFFHSLLTTTWQRELVAPKPLVRSHSSPPDPTVERVAGRRRILEGALAQQDDSTEAAAASMPQKAASSPPGTIARSLSDVPWEVDSKRLRFPQAEPQAEPQSSGAKSAGSSDTASQKSDGKEENIALDILKEALLLKSALGSEDDATDRPLAILEDGVRYEAPSDSKDSPMEQSVAAMQVQLKELTHTISLMRDLLQPRILPRARPTPKATLRAFRRRMQVESSEL